MSKWDKAIEQICEGVKPTMRSKSMNKRIKKKKLKQFKQWIKDNVKITYSVERLDNGYCKVCATIGARK